MALSLRCSCKAHFEAEDTFAGQVVSCPDCGAALKVPVVRPTTLRTSGFALASVTAALVGAFTLVGTLTAIVLGVIGLVSVIRHRDRVRGAGFAVFGIILGVVFTALTGLAVVHNEIFDPVRERMTSGEVDRSGPMEVVRKDNGFAITRPTRQWGVATPDYASELDCTGKLVLVNSGRNAFINISQEDANRRTLEQVRDRFLDNYRSGAAPFGKANPFDGLRHFSNFKLRESRRLPPERGIEALEVFFDAKATGQNFSYHARLLKPKESSEVYIVLAWAHSRRLPQFEEEIRRAMDSFRLLSREW